MKPPCKNCGKESKYGKVGLCSACYQRARNATPEGKARTRAAHVRWYQTRGGRERARARTRVYVATRRPLLHIWNGIKRRTSDRPDKHTLSHWMHYGGRGIRMHAPWRADYALFEANVLAECGPRPNRSYSLDRINNDGHYEPGNLRWADQRTQRANTREQIALREREGIFRRIAHMEALIDDALSFDRAALAQAA